ncbi:RNA polymerase sigma factor RpoD/SigA [Fibrobacterota bacterium]
MAAEKSSKSLGLYIKDIKGSSHFSLKEEQELFALLRKGSRTARDMLLRSNMRFVLKVALQYQKSPLPLSDLISEGAMGLIMAIDNFDPSRGIKFISYAVWWIKAYITRSINEHSSLIRIPSNQALKMRKALRSGLPKDQLDDDIKELIRLCERGLSLDAPVNGEAGNLLYETIVDDNFESPDNLAQSNSVKKYARSLLARLPEREAEVLKACYGLDNGVPGSLREVGDRLDLSNERVRQLRNKAIQRLQQDSEIVNWAFNVYRMNGPEDKRD